MSRRLRESICRKDPHAVSDEGNRNTNASDPEDTKRFSNPSMRIDCSIIICTRNRATTLERTLHSFRSVKVPDGWAVELIVADNGSTDETAGVVGAASQPAMEIRHVFQPRPGKSRAQNAAVAQARGEVLLFTDDDVEPAVSWLENMARPVLDGGYDAAAGRILLADDVRRPWFTNLHAIWLAEAGKLEDFSPELIGASMAIHRTVFDRIGCFDEELGPGASGFGEETLFWQQMKEAGMRIHPVNDTFVIHHPDTSRLLHSDWLDAAARRGRSMAYVQYHWEHRQVPHPSLCAFWVWLKLCLRRLTSDSVRPDAEGCLDWEMSYVARLESFKAFIAESRRPRNYEFRGLRRKAS